MITWVVCYIQQQATRVIIKFKFIFKCVTGHEACIHYPSTCRCNNFLVWIQLLQHLTKWKCRFTPSISQIPPLFYVSQNLLVADTCCNKSRSVIAGAFGVNPRFPSSEKNTNTFHSCINIHFQHAADKLLFHVMELSQSSLVPCETNKHGCMHTHVWGEGEGEGSKCARFTALTCFPLPPAPS